MHNEPEVLTYLLLYIIWQTLPAPINHDDESH